MNATEEQSNRESPSGTERSPKEEETVSLGTAESSSSPSCRPLKKRRLEMQNDKVDATESTKETEASSGMSQKRQISFNDGRNVTHLQTDPSHDFPSEYKESDIWYTREDYEHFLMDRIHTIERLRGSVMEPHNDGETTAAATKEQEFDHCVRGLEPFQNRSTHQDMHSKRRLHKSTIITEQVRQAMLGIKDPERFRFLVAPQSNMALHRAQELAAMDEEEVYPRRVQRKRNSRRSSMSAAVPSGNKNLNHQRMDSHLGHHYDRANICLSMFNNPAMNRSVMSASSLLPSVGSMGRRASMGHNATVSMPATNASSSHNNSMPYPSIFSSSIRQLQEKNAQRLMEMYGKPGGGKNGSNLFRFSLRRDSLLGSIPGDMGQDASSACKAEDLQQQQHSQQGLMAMMPVATRFHLRRDSLSHLATK